MVAFGVQPEFTCKLAVAGEEHGTNDADDVARVRFVGVLKIGSDGCIEGLVRPWRHPGKGVQSALDRGGCSEDQCHRDRSEPATPLLSIPRSAAPSHARQGY